MTPRDRVLAQRPHWKGGKVGCYWIVICDGMVVESTRSETHSWLMAERFLEGLE